MFSYPKLSSHTGTYRPEYGGTSYNPRLHAKIAEREGFQLGNGIEDPRTLYVGNLDPAISEDFLVTLFNQIGAVTKAKMIFEGYNDPYAFVEFRNNMEASKTRDHMKDQLLLGKKMKVNWAVEAGQPDRSKIDTARHFHVFVGDLSSEVDSKMLHEAFAKYGTVSEAKVIKDTATNKPKGYGFVSYPKREDAERAIEQMNGQWLGRRTIRTNWASRKPEEDGRRGGGGGERGGGGGGGQRTHFGKTFDDIFNQTSADNTSVYVGNINNLSENELREAFAGFGQINEVRIFRSQGYAFVKYMEKEPAAQAILQMNNQMISGVPVRCSWGKNHSDSGNQGRGGDRGGGGDRSGGHGNYGYSNQAPPGFYEPNFRMH